MKKLLKVLALVAVVACCAVAVAFAGCGESAKTYDGEYKYENAWTAGNYYGVKVHVTVKEGKITKVTYDADTDTMHNVTPTWDGHDVTVAALDSYLAKFEGKTVEEVKALKVKVEEGGAPSKVDQGQTLAAAWLFDLSYVKDGKTIKTGATQTAGRFVLAIQDALKNV